MKLTLEKVIAIIVDMGYTKHEATEIALRLEEIDLLNIRKRSDKSSN